MLRPVVGRALAHHAACVAQLAYELIDPCADFLHVRIFLGAVCFDAAVGGMCMGTYWPASSRLQMYSAASRSCSAFFFVVAVPAVRRVGKRLRGQADGEVRGAFLVHILRERGGGAVAEETLGQPPQ